MDQEKYYNSEIDILENNNEILEQIIESKTEKLVRNNNEELELKQDLIENEYSAKEAMLFCTILFGLKVSILVARK